MPEYRVNFEIEWDSGMEWTTVEAESEEEAEQKVEEMVFAEWGSFLPTRVREVHIENVELL